MTELRTKQAVQTLETVEAIQPVTVNMAGAPVPGGKVSYADFLEWADEDTYAEWVDGEIELMSSPASRKHQDVKGFLESAIRLFAETYDLGEVYSAGLQMKLPGSGREPDVLFISTARLGQLKETFLDGPADLAVEIVSPESVERDKVEKLAEYQAGGVLEYWLIDVIVNKAAFYQLGKTGKYRKVAPDPKGRYTSAVIPGFWLQTDWLWQKPLPNVQDILLEIAGADYATYLLSKLQARGHLPPG